MPDAFIDFVASYERLLGQAPLLADAALPAATLSAPLPDAPSCLVFSPHPDDEAIAGALPWRLRSEEGWRVVNVAVTLGSRRERRVARWLELERCCSYLGFELASATGVTGAALENITPQAAVQDAAHWRAAVDCAASWISRVRPVVIVCPHALDGHPAHIGTHALVVAALQQVHPEWRIHLLQSEYWNTQLQPALMLQLQTHHVATLVCALSMHVGEVQRNPYHLSLPAWFIDSARRGSERVGAPGADASGMVFAALYGWQCWQGGVLAPMPTRAVFAGQEIAPLFA